MPDRGEASNHLNAKQANKITLRHAERDAATVDQLQNLLMDIDGQDGKCNQQQLLPQGSFAALRDRKNKTRAKETSSSNAANIGEGCIKNADNTEVQFQQQIAQLRSDKMTQYANTGSHAHSKLDIQKVPEDVQQKQQHRQNSNIAQRTSLSGTTATPAPTTGLTARCVGGEANTGNINIGTPSAYTSEPYKGPKPWRYIVRFWTTTSQKFALFMIFLMLWALAYCILPEYTTVETGIMRLVFLFVGAELAGILVTFLRLPDMLGMLFFGVLYTNLGLADFSGYQRLEAILRELALINIMLLAGLGLNASAFRKLWFMITRLTVLPTLAEVAIIAVLSRYLLSMPWLWGILLGLVITAVSPNVVVTVMLKLKEDCLGLNNGIHTIIYATTTCNDVFAIFCFGVVLGVVFSTDSLTEQILQGPIGIGIGIVFGYLYGMMLHYLPSKKSTYLNGLRFVLTILGGCLAVMGSRAIGYPSGGALGCAFTAFIASIGWKRQDSQMELQQQQANETASVPKRLDLLWKFLKPISFSLIGKEINFDVLDLKLVGYGFLLIIVGSLLRLAVGYISTYGGDLTRKERAYITICGIPKATVQAALGPIALDLARSRTVTDQDQLSFAAKVLIVSVLAIILTAPLGAILMLRLAPRWLKFNPNGVDTDECIDGSTDAENNDELWDNTTDSMSKFTPASNFTYGSNKSHGTVNIDIADASDATGGGNPDVLRGVNNGETIDKLAGQGLDSKRY